MNNDYYIPNLTRSWMHFHKKYMWTKGLLGKRIRLVSPKLYRGLSRVRQNTRLGFQLGHVMIESRINKMKHLLENYLTYNCGRQNNDLQLCPYLYLRNLWICYVTWQRNWLVYWSDNLTIRRVPWMIQVGIVWLQGSFKCGRGMQRV